MRIPDLQICSNEFHSSNILLSGIKTATYYQIKLHCSVVKLRVLIWFAPVLNCGETAQLGPCCLIVEVSRSHTIGKTSGRTPLNERPARRRGHYLHNTQQTKQTNIRAFSGIRTRNPNNRRFYSPVLFMRSTMASENETLLVRAAPGYLPQRKICRQKLRLD